MNRRATALVTCKTAKLALVAGGLILAGTAVGILSGDNARATTASAEPHSAAKSTLPGSFSSVIERVSPAVVSIRVTHRSVSASVAEDSVEQWTGPDGMDEFPKRFFGEDWSRRFGDGERQRQFRWQPAPGRPVQGTGSGFVIDPQGFVVTNDHVVREASRITVVFQGGKEYQAKLIGRDSLTDLALLKIEATEGLPYVKFSESGPAKVGDWVVAIGNPFGLGNNVRNRTIARSAIVHHQGA